MEEFEAEIRRILDEKFIEKSKSLKKTGHIFNPIFYLFFTRLVELSAIFRNIVLPNRYEIGATQTTCCIFYTEWGAIHNSTAHTVGDRG